LNQLVKPEPTISNKLELSFNLFYIDSARFGRFLLEKIMGFWDIFKPEKKKRIETPGVTLSVLLDSTQAPNGVIRRRVWVPGDVIHFFRAESGVFFFNKTPDGFKPYIPPLLDHTGEDWEIVSLADPVRPGDFDAEKINMEEL